MEAGTANHPGVMYGIMVFVFIGVPFLYIVIGTLRGTFDKPKQRENPMWQTGRQKSRWRGGGPS